MSMFKTAPDIAHGAPRGACAEGGPSVSGQGGEMLLMVDYPKCGNAETVLRSLNELQPGGTVSHVIPYRSYCACKLFQGESTKRCISVQPCSSTTNKNLNSFLGMT